MSRKSRSLPEVSLGPLDSAHLALAREWRNMPEVYRWCRQYEPVSQAHHDRYWSAVATDPTTKMYGIFADDNDKPAFLGVGGFTSIDWVNRRAEFSLFIAPSWHGSGYGEAAARALCRHGFDVLNLNCIWAESYEGSPAIRLGKRIGFVEEGRRREFYFRNGKYIDAVLFSLLKQDF